MSPLKSLLAAASVAVLSGVAIAQTAPDASSHHGWQKPNPEQMAAWHAQRCSDLYARKAGRLAYLQAALSITEAQRGAFDQWRDAELGAAKERSAACLAHAPEEHHEHNALEQNARMEKMMETRLAELRNERPALEALYNSLSPEQKEVFDRSEHGFGHGHGHHMGERGEERGDRGSQAPG